MNNLQLHFRVRCSREERHRKELGEMPTHLLTKWNNREHSEQERSSNLLCLGDKWDRKQWEDKESKKNKNKKNPSMLPVSEVRISCFCSNAHSASEENRATLGFHL